MAKSVKRYRFCISLGMAFAMAMAMAVAVAYRSRISPAAVKCKFETIEGAIVDPTALIATPLFG